MNISEETFPDDMLYITTIDCKTNVSTCVSSSSGGNDQNLSASTSGQSSSGTSHETTQSDPVKNPESREDEEYTQKARSCHDLHSVYTKRRFSHVKSKVREFIESQKAEDNLRISTNEFIERISTPEILDSCKNQMENSIQTDKKSNHQADTHSELVQVLDEKEQEMMCLKALNEYLQSSLQEKMIEATRLRRNMDSMRIELMHAKDKAKRHSMHSIGMEVRNHYSPRLSLPTLVYKLPRNTTGTQTEFLDSPITTDKNNNSVGFYESKNIATIQPICLNFSTEQVNALQRQFRRRNTSNPPTLTDGQMVENNPGSDHGGLMLSTEEGDSSLDNILREEFLISEKDSCDTTTSGRPKKMLFKRKWKWLFGPCVKCGEKKNTSLTEYSQTPLLDQITENRIRCDERTSS